MLESMKRDIESRVLRMRTNVEFEVKSGEFEPSSIGMVSEKLDACIPHEFEIGVGYKVGSYYGVFEERSMGKEVMLLDKGCKVLACIQYTEWRKELKKLEKKEQKVLLNFKRGGLADEEFLSELLEIHYKMQEVKSKLGDFVEGDTFMIKDEILVMDVHLGNFETVYRSLVNLYECEIEIMLDGEVDVVDTVNRLRKVKEEMYHEVRFKNGSYRLYGEYGSVMYTFLECLKEELSDLVNSIKSYEKGPSNIPF